VKGRKRHLLVDTEGLVLKAVVSAADVLDRDGGELLGWAVRLFGPNLPRLVKVWADGAYEHLAEWMRALMGWELEVVARPAGQKGFVVLPRRWVVERSFAWLGRFRRLSKEYEYRVESSEAFIYLGSSVHMLRRLAHLDAHQLAGST
jgi:putative transposase